MNNHQAYMNRCIELAQKGAGFVAPNPMVGAVLVYENTIIGEGWHEQYGHAHAEVNCINSVLPAHQQLIPQSTLYVSLEPCAHVGKTPPCSDLIIAKQIKQVVIGCRDPFKEVNGKGIEQLKAAGVDVMVDVLKKECENLNQRFFTFHQQKRPYVILKWAQTKNGKIGYAQPEGKIENAATQRLMISNEFTNKLVHKWRSEEASILVGTNTALLDDPRLTNRLGKGNQPTRVVIDRELKLPSTLQLFHGHAKTIVLNTMKHNLATEPQYYQLNKGNNSISEIAAALYNLNLQSVLVEGGAKLLQSFIDEGLWDEARVIENQSLTIDNGLNAPVLTNAQLLHTEHVLTDSISYYHTNQPANNHNQV